MTREVNEIERLRKSNETYQKQLACARRYRRTAKGREAARRYDQSEKKRVASRRYRESESYAKTRERYRTREDVTERQREYNREYFQHKKHQIMLRRRTHKMPEEKLLIPRIPITERDTYMREFREEEIAKYDVGDVYIEGMWGALIDSSVREMDISEV